MLKKWQLGNLFYKISLNYSSENNKFNLKASNNSIAYIDISNSIPYLFYYYVNPHNSITYTKYSFNNLSSNDLDFLVEVNLDNDILISVNDISNSLSTLYLKNNNNNSDIIYSIFQNSLITNIAINNNFIFVHSNNTINYFTIDNSYNIYTLSTPNINIDTYSKIKIYNDTLIIGSQEVYGKKFKMVKASL